MQRGEKGAVLSCKGLRVGRSGLEVRHVLFMTESGRWRAWPASTFWLGDKGWMWMEGPGRNIPGGAGEAESCAVFVCVIREGATI